MPVSPSKRAWISAVLGTLVLAGYLCHVWYFRIYVNDDAYITYRYSLNLAAGLGPYYNAGEHVEGYTNFLLMVILAAITKLGGSGIVPVAAKIIGTLGGLLALVATWGLCARWLRKNETLAPSASLLAWTAPALVAVNAAFAVNSVSGLETTLFSGWIMLGLWLTQISRDETRWRGAGLAFALAALTRPEAVVVVAGTFLGRLLAGDWRQRGARTSLVLDLSLPAAVALAHAALRVLLYDGELVPNTYYAKTGGFSAFIAAHTYIRGFAWKHLGGPASVAVFLPLLAPAALHRAVLPALLSLLLAIAGIFWTGSDWMLAYRLLVPYAPIWAALSVCGLAAVVTRLRPSTWLAAAACALLLLATSFQSTAGREYHDFCTTGAHGYEVGHVALAHWLSEHAKPDDTVALMDIGLVGFYCPNLRILDLTGLTDRHIAKSSGPFLDKDYAPAYIFRQRPEYVVIVMTAYRDEQGTLHYNPWTAIEARLTNDPEFARHYYHPRQPAVGDNPFQALAATWGAACGFQHDAGPRLYLLTVYKYEP